MLTEDLTAGLQGAVASQPSSPDIAGAWQRGSRRRRQRRALGATTGVALVAGTALALTPLLGSPGGVHQGSYAALSPAHPGEVDFTVEPVTGPEVGVSCALQLVLAAPLSPARASGQPCAPFDLSRALPPVDSRQDVVTLDGARYFLTAGTAPAGTVQVSATDTEGRPLTASLRHPTFTSEVVFAFLTPGPALLHLDYRLADGRTGYEQEINQPDT